MLFKRVKEMPEGAKKRFWFTTTSQRNKSSKKGGKSRSGLLHGVSDTHVPQAA
jgi:hypothetical protein